MPTSTALSTETVQPSQGLGTAFGFDAKRFLGEREPVANRLDFRPLDDDPLFGDLVTTAREFLSGQLPADVEREIRRSSAERSVQGGYAGTQLSRNLTLRDIGKTSLEMKDRGATLGAAVSELGLRRDVAGRELELQTGQFNEAIRQFNDQFALSLRAADDRGAELAMRALSLQSANRQFRISEENRLIIQNSVSEIQGLQGNIDSMDNLFDNFDRQFQGLINLYTQGA